MSFMQDSNRPKPAKPGQVTVTPAHEQSVKYVPEIPVKRAEWTEQLSMDLSAKAVMLLKEGRSIAGGDMELLKAVLHISVSMLTYELHERRKR